MIPPTRVLDLDDETAVALGRPLLEIARLVLDEAFNSSASQVHLELVDGRGLMVRFMVEGEWRPVMRMPPMGGSSLVNVLKVWAELDVAKRPKQEGRLTIRRRGAEQVVRIVTQVEPNGAEALWVHVEPSGEAAA